MKKVVLMILVAMLLLGGAQATTVNRNPVMFELYVSNANITWFTSEISCVCNDLQILFTEVGQEVNVSTRWNEAESRWELIVETEGKVLRLKKIVGSPYYDLSDVTWRYEYTGKETEKIKVVAEGLPKEPEGHMEVYLIDKEGNFLMKNMPCFGLYGDNEYKVDTVWFKSDDIVTAKLTNKGVIPKLVYMLVDRKPAFESECAHGREVTYAMPISEGFMMTEYIINRVPKLVFHKDNLLNRIISIPAEDLRGKGDVWITLVEDEVVIIPVSEKEKEEIE